MPDQVGWSPMRQVAAYLIRFAMAAYVRHERPALFEKARVPIDCYYD